MATLLGDGLKEAVVVSSTWIVTCEFLLVTTMITEKVDHTDSKGLCEAVVVVANYSVDKYGTWHMAMASAGEYENGKWTMD